MSLRKISVEEFHALRTKEPATQMIDVREPMEYQSGAIPNTKNLPLSEINAWLHQVDKQKPVYVVCRSGNRASQAAEKLQAKGCEVCVVDGGLDAWKSKQLPVTESKTQIWELERQVRFAAGLLVVMGILLSWWVHPSFLYVSLFVGCGLIFAAVTNTCGMGLMLGRCPWNRKCK